jgi:crossover junction endodeoxyribonuclease RuvC
MTAIAGLDPGAATGALAVLTDGVACVHDLPSHTIVTSTGKRQTQLDPHGLCALLVAARIDHAFIESVKAMPRQGVVSTWGFGYACGCIYGCIAALGIPVTFVLPRAWQSFHKIGREPDASLRRAVQLYPMLGDQLRRKRDNHRADALLLAAYGMTLRQ